MEHCKLLYSKKAVQRAGEKLIINNIINDQPEEYKESMQILSNWRSSAAKPLYASTLELQYSACVSPYKCLLHIFMLYGYLSLAALVI